MCTLTLLRSGSRATRAVAGLLGGTLRLHRRAPAWWRKVSTLPFRLFTGLLRRHLGRWAGPGRAFGRGVCVVLLV